MKHLLLINGTMGAGKSTVCRELNKALSNSVWLDGDWCWMADPFVVNESTKAMVMDNIQHVLRNFLLQEAYEHVLFCWVMDEEKILSEVEAGLQDIDCKITRITLRLQDETLKQHLQADIDQGIRKPGCIEQSFKRQKKYEALQSIKVDIDGLSVQDIICKIKKIIGE